MKVPAVLLVLALLAAACSDPITSPAGSIAGHYRSTIFIVPTLTDGQDSLHLRGDYIDLTLDNAGGLLASIRRSRESGGTVVITIDSLVGTYTVRNDSVFMQTSKVSELTIPGWVRMRNDIEISLRGLGAYHIFLKRQS